MRLEGRALDEPWLATISLATLASGPASMEAAGWGTAPQKAPGLAQVRGAPVGQQPVPATP